MGKQFVAFQFTKVNSDFNEILWGDFLKFLLISKHALGGWQWNLFVHCMLQVHWIIIHMLLDSFGLIKYLMLFIHWLFSKSIEQLGINVFLSWNKHTYSLDWLLCDNLFIYSFFFLSGAVSCYGRYLQITFCFHVSLVFKIYIWYKGAAVGLAGCFLICFSVVENVSLIVLSRTSYFKIDFSYMQ